MNDSETNQGIYSSSKQANSLESLINGSDLEQFDKFKLVRIKRMVNLTHYVPF